MFRPSFNWLCVLFLLGGMILSSAVAAHSGEPVRREVLALYHSDLEPSVDSTLVHLNAELPLNHLGYIVTYHDLKRGLPGEEDLANAVALLSMFPEDLPDHESYFEWLGAITRTSDLRVIMLNNPGGSVTGHDADILNSVFHRIGLELTPKIVANTLTSSVVARDDAMVGFEREPDPVPERHPLVRRYGNTARVALEYESRDGGDLSRSVAVATGPGGGYAAPGFFIYYDSELDQKRWIIDPFEFFARALGTELFPVPDTTTVSGRRLFFSHVDGDGWKSLTRIERYRDRPTLSADVMLRELVAPYPDIPVTIGPVASDLEPAIRHGKDAARIARELFALPQVEIGSHTYTHPFVWEYFETYDRSDELALIRNHAFNGSTSIFSRFGSLISSKRATPDILLEESDEALPRFDAREPFSLKKEVAGALRMIEALAPPGKHVEVYQWSGDAEPFEAAIGAVRKSGLRNLNGGETRFDATRPSVSHISPISRQVGAQRQIYALNDNEYTYTNLWRGRFNGFTQLIETFRRTENPRRLRGANLYYHAYSAERSVSLDAVRSILDWAREEPVAPIRASHYAAIADGFFSTKIRKIGDLRWSVSDRDGLQTVRFDNAGGLRIDLAASAGVLGETRHGGSLYVALDPTVGTAIVGLQRDHATNVPQTLDTAMLEQARWRISSLERKSCRLAFLAEGFGAGDFLWRAPNGRYRISVSREGAELLATQVTSSANGELHFTLPFRAIEPARVEIACETGEQS